jgi:uncharacterized protein (DUF4415 family)
MANHPNRSRRGRPPKRPEDRRVTPSLSLRVPVEIVEAWRASGPGWQTRMIELLTREAP